MKKRILACGEFTQLNTGYGVYWRNVLTELAKEYEVAEFAAWISDNDPKNANTPWKVYGTHLPNLHDDKDPQVRSFKSDPQNVFGKYRFNEVVLDFKPDYVLDIRDHWMMDYQLYSPFRECYNLIWMPTVDSPNQHPDWLFDYSQADGIFTYQDWSLDQLRKESNFSINLLGSAPPSADPAFNIRLSRKREFFGDKFVVGFVSRNQPRKRFPELIRLLPKLPEDIVLYFHTSYPDRGWYFPDLLVEFGVGDRVYFNYICHQCAHAEPRLFKDLSVICPKCKAPSMAMPNTNTGYDNNQLAEAYNMMDLYIQYSNSEGLGIGQIEAAACGVPVCGTAHSAMLDVIPKLNGQLIDCSTYLEIETGCWRAVPHEDSAIKTILNFYNNKNVNKTEIRRAYETNYGSWLKIADKWKNAIENTPVRGWSIPDKSQPAKITQEIADSPNDYFVKWLLSEVWRKPNFLNTYLEGRLTTALEYGKIMYCNGPPRWEPFNKEIAYKYYFSKRIEELKWILNLEKQTQS